MSATTIYMASQDPDLIKRVTALANKEVRANDALADTDYGRQLLQGFGQISVLMWPVAVDNEASYEAALLNGRGAPGHDSDVITDAAITAAIVNGWPPNILPTTPPVTPVVTAPVEVEEVQP